MTTGGLSARIARCHYTPADPRFNAATLKFAGLAAQTKPVPGASRSPQAQPPSERTGSLVTHRRISRTRHLEGVVDLQSLFSSSLERFWTASRAWSTATLCSELREPLTTESSISFPAITDLRLSAGVLRPHEEPIGRDKVRARATATGDAAGKATVAVSCAPISPDASIQRLAGCFQTYRIAVDGSKLKAVNNRGRSLGKGSLHLQLYPAVVVVTKPLESARARNTTLPELWRHYTTASRPDRVLHEERFAANAGDEVTHRSRNVSSFKTLT